MLGFLVDGHICLKVSCLASLHTYKQCLTGKDFTFLLGHTMQVFLLDYIIHFSKLLPFSLILACLKSALLHVQ